MTELVGRRVPDDFDWRETKPGDYGKQTWFGNGRQWWICDPFGAPGSLRSHTVTEHDDGTITVEPSILDPDDGGFHGFLRKGVWTW